MNFKKLLVYKQFYIGGIRILERVRLGMAQKRFGNIDLKQRSKSYKEVIKRFRFLSQLKTIDSD